MVRFVAVGDRGEAHIGGKMVQEAQHSVVFPSLL